MCSRDVMNGEWHGRIASTAAKCSFLMFHTACKGAQDVLILQSVDQTACRNCTVPNCFLSWNNIVMA